MTSSCPQAACQNFETELQPAVWSLSSKGGTAKVVSDEIKALRGTGKAMQFHLLKTNEEAASTGFVSLKTVPDAVKKGGGDLFARFYTYCSGFALKLSSRKPREN